METSKKVTSSTPSGPTKAIQTPTDLIGVQIGDFLIEKFLAQGGMALVFRGLQITLKRPVAIKILKAKLSRSQKMIARFNREIEALSTLSHPNIVSIFGKGKAKINDSEHYFFAMEYVDGKGLRNIIRDGTLDELTTYRLTLEILDALDYAHKKGIIHRDIKPENILLTGQKHIKITDFGIAHIENNEDQQLTEENASIGTKAYMAPEQNQDSRSVDARADIYSTGVLLYEMLTGVIPRGVFEPATVVNKKLEFPIDPIIFKAMAHDREKRFSSAREMYEKLEEFLQTSYLEQHRPQIPISPPPKAPKSSRKFFFFFLLLVVVGVTIAFNNPLPLLKKHFPQLFVALNRNSEQNPSKEENKDPQNSKDPVSKQPEDTTKQPEDTTKQPEDTTKQPEDTTKQPEDTTKQPEDTTKQPIDTTKQPEDTTKQPEDTTKQPIDTTKQPEDTTKQPEDTTKQPEAIKIEFLSEGERFFWIAKELIRQKHFGQAKDYLARARSDQKLLAKVEEHLQEIQQKSKLKTQAKELETHGLRLLKLKKYNEALPFLEDACRLYPSLNLILWIDKASLGLKTEKTIPEYQEKLKDCFLYMGYGQWAKAKEFLEQGTLLYPEGKTIPELKNYIQTLEEQTRAMILVKLGRFPRGEKNEQIFLSSYFIDKTEVSQEDYARFVHAISYPPPKDWAGKNNPPSGLEKHPVRFIDYHDALAYALWSQKQLPTEAQWEKAARGTQGFVYPWGEEWNPKYCHFNQSGPASAIPVTDLPQGASPYGCLNMAGNVWEWCRDYYQDQYESALKNPQGPEQGLERVVRGGGWSNTDPKPLKTFSRHHLSPDQQLPDLGFRLALEINIPEALDH